MAPAQQAASLYELALSALQPPVPLQISPATLKSAMGGLIDVLLDRQIAATLWVKLPPGSAWLSDIERYRQQAGSKIYLCLEANTAPEPAAGVEYLSGELLPDLAGAEARPGYQSGGRMAEKRSRSSVLDADKRHGQVRASQPERLAAGGGGDTPAPPAGGPAFSVGLAPEFSLRREYFLLVLSEQLCGIVIAHRPRSVRLPAQAAAGGASTHPLLALCSADRETVKRAWEGLGRAIALGAPAAGAAGAAASNFPGTLSEPVPANPEELLANWDSLFPSAPASNDAGPASADSVPDYLWAKQIQRQEEVWRSAVHYRQQAADADALQRQNQELQEASHLKDEFLNNVGQALRTPLTNMKTALTLLSSANLKPDQRKRYMQLLNTECDRQTSLINGLLELVQLDMAGEHTEMQPLPLADMVPGVVSTYQPLAQEKGIMLAYTVPDDLPPVSCLRPWLKQIVINLLHNAIKFTASGGQVWVRAKQQGDYIQLEFRDTGKGVPPQELPKIFDRFYRVRQTVDEDPGGAGLGLTIVQQLLLRCGGSISVKSQMGHGSTFKVLLPVYHNSTDE
jgi:signal transduction histidine kinase